MTKTKTKPAEPVPGDAEMLRRTREAEEKLRAWRESLRPDDRLNIYQAAAYLGVGRTTVSRLVADDRIRHTRVSDRIVDIRVGDLIAYRDRQTTGGTAA